MRNLLVVAIFSMTFQVLADCPGCTGQIEPSEASQKVEALAGDFEKYVKEIKKTAHDEQKERLTKVVQSLSGNHSEVVDAFKEAIDGGTYSQQEWSASMTNGWTCTLSMSIGGTGGLAFYYLGCKDKNKKTIYSNRGEECLLTSDPGKGISCAG